MANVSMLKRPLAEVIYRKEAVEAAAEAAIIGEAAADVVAVEVPGEVAVAAAAVIVSAALFDFDIILVL